MKKLLIVEDDKNWADILCSYAAMVGADTRAVVSGGQAMEMIDNWQPDALTPYPAALSRQTAANPPN